MKKEGKDKDKEREKGKLGGGKEREKGFSYFSASNDVWGKKGRGVGRGNRGLRSWKMKGAFWLGKGGVGGEGEGVGGLPRVFEQVFLF